MATLTPKPVVHTGLVLADADLAGAGVGGSGDKAPTGAGLVLYVKNGDSASHDVVLATPGTVDGLAIADRTVTVAAGDVAFIPLKDLYKDPSDSLAHITYSATTSVLVAVLRVGV